MLSRSYNKDVNLFYYFIPTELHVYTLFQKTSIPHHKAKFSWDPPPPFFYFLDEKEGALPTQPPCKGHFHEETCLVKIKHLPQMI